MILGILTSILDFNYEDSVQNLTFSQNNYIDLDQYFSLLNKVTILNSIVIILFMINVLKYIGLIYERIQIQYMMISKVIFFFF